MINKNILLIISFIVIVTETTVSIAMPLSLAYQRVLVCLNYASFGTNFFMRMFPSIEKRLKNRRTTQAKKTKKDVDVQIEAELFPLFPRILRENIIKKMKDHRNRLDCNHNKQQVDQIIRNTYNLVRAGATVVPPQILCIR